MKDTYTWIKKKKKKKKGELSFGGRWAPKLIKGSYNSSN